MEANNKIHIDGEKEKEKDMVALAACSLLLFARARMASLRAAGCMATALPGTRSSDGGRRGGTCRKRAQAAMGWNDKSEQHSVRLAGTM